MNAWLLVVLAVLAIIVLPSPARAGEARGVAGTSSGEEDDEGEESVPLEVICYSVGVR